MTTSIRLGALILLAISGFTIGARSQSLESLYGTYTTPEGGWVVLDGQGADISGYFKPTRDATPIPIAGENTKKNLLELRVTGIDGLILDAVALKLRKEVVQTETGYQIFADWSANGIDKEPSLLPRTMYGMLEANSSSITQNQVSENSPALSDIVSADKFIDDYFQSRGVKTQSYIDNVFDFMAENGSVTFQFPRKYAAPIIAYGLDETEFNGVFPTGVSGMDFQTLGPETALATIEKSGWNKIWAAADRNTNNNATWKEVRVTHHSLSNPFPTIRVNTGEFAKLFDMEAIEQKNSMKEKIGLGGDDIYCWVDSSHENFYIGLICDHHSHRYGFKKHLVWMQSYILFKLGRDSVGNAEDITIFPKSTIALGFTVSEYGTIKPADYDKNASNYQFYQSQQEYFVNEVHSLVKQLEQS